MLTSIGQLPFPRIRSKEIDCQVSELRQSIFFVIIVFPLRDLIHDLKGQSDYINHQTQQAKNEGKQGQSL